MAETDSKFLHIVRVPGIMGGEPTIRGTRVPVRAIALHYLCGASEREIQEAYPHISIAAIREAIDYYRCHQEEIERLIEENRLENVLGKCGATLEDGGVIVFRKR